MANLIQTTTELAMHIVCGYIKPGDTLVDATCGNGLDTLRLARTAPQKLYAFDIQKQAIDNTRRLLIDNGFSSELDNNTIRLIADSHENIDSYVTLPVKAIVFNLGYLPGGCKEITTSKVSTRTAAEKALNILQKDGILCITMYSGHREGADEKETLLKWSSQLEPHTYHSAYISINNQKNDPPEILLITKKR